MVLLKDKEISRVSLTRANEAQLRHRGWYGIGALVLFTSIALVDWKLAPDASLAHLYYLPILLASVKVGRRLALTMALASMVVYHLLDPDLIAFHYGEADVLQLVLFLVVGVVSSRLAEQEREMRRLAGTDDLTGLHNLRSLTINVRRELEVPENRGGMAAMLGVDVDRLKQINDVHGHLTGADAVRHVGRVIARSIPRRAIACRYGGDEFVIFIPRCDEAEAIVIAERICASIRDSAVTLAGHAFERGALSVSVGVTTRRMTLHGSQAWGREGPRSIDKFAEDMFRETDGAMYMAKAAGRDGVMLHHHDAPDHARRLPITLS
jgi:diguanylate cyclase (GGDEF)-like protein